MADAPVNPFIAATEALKNGTDIEQAVYGKPGSTPTQDNAVKDGDSEKPEIQVEEVSSTDEPIFGEKAQPSEEKEAPAKEAKAAPSKDVKPAQPDKAKQYEQGMRKFQAERDSERKARLALEKEHGELKTHWGSLEEAFQNEGIAGVINLISGDKEGYKKHTEAEYARRKAREDATPAQKQAMDLEERILQEQKARQVTEKQMKELRSEVNKTKDETEQKALQSVVNPLFEKYRFTGKLGDEESEYYYDKALWRETVDNLEALPEEQVTREAIENEFRKVSGAYRKVINKQVDSKVKKTIETKKASAQESAAAKAMSGMSTSAAADEFRGNIRSGNITNAFRQLLSGKIKLS